jgi:hypothetical protein
VSIAAGSIPTTSTCTSNGACPINLARTKMNEFYTVKDVAKIFRVNREETIRNWIRRGLFPNAIKTDGYLIPQRDIDAFIKSKGLKR